MPDKPEVDEPVDAGDHDVPADLVELHEVLAWEAAVAEQEAAGVDTAPE